MTKEQIRTVTCGIFHDVIEVDELSEKARAELREATESLLAAEMESQMTADFATIPDPVNGPMRRARTLVEAHIADYGMVPHPDKIKDAIAVEIGLAEIRGADRSLKSIRSLEHTKEQLLETVGLQQKEIVRLYALAPVSRLNCCDITTSVPCSDCPRAALPR